MAQFNHLHLHTEYSLLDGVCHIKDLVPRLKELGYKSCAITDHGVLYGAFQFYTLCKEVGIKPIIGCELYLATRTRFDKDPSKDRKPYHMTVVAKNLEGYKNLIKLVSFAQLEGVYYKPRVDDELLKKYGKGIIAFSGCLNGKIPRLLEAGKIEEAKKTALKFQSYFGKDSFYIEVMRNGMKEVDESTVLLEKFAKEMDIPILATCDTHYIRKEDNIGQEILFCVSDNKKLTDPDHRKYPTHEFYVKSPEELAELFKDKPEYIANTEKVADMIEEYDITFGRVEPIYSPLPAKMNVAEYLKTLVYEGAAKRYGTLTDEIKNRIEYELGIIHMKNYDNYFLVVQDYVKWAKDHDIMVGPGRGSGAGSILAYCLGITDLVDPIYWKLPFERFLNPERPSPPDFDIDFEDTRREEVINYLKEKYGEKRVSNIAAIGRMKTKAAIRDVARVMGIDLSIADKFSKMVPVHQGHSPLIKECMDTVPEMVEMVNTFPELHQLVENVVKVEGTARHVSKHACGIVVTPKDLVEYVPLQKESRNENSIITQYEGPYLEALGLLKFDFLGLSNLTQIKSTVKLIKKTRNIDLDINNIPFDDSEVYKLLKKGKTLGIFQFESEGFQKYLKDLVPETIFELSFMGAAYRPGPIAYITPYINCKFGREKPVYLHPDLKPVLEETYGFPIYQEQLMEIAVVMAGYSLGRADILRRAIGKKKIEVLMAEKESFVQAVAENGYTKELGDQLFEYMIPFASYGFNKAHSACYAIISYQTSYLKTHYFPEFMAVLLETNLGDFDKVSKINEECAENNVSIFPPDINRSDKEFTIDNGNIRFGLNAIKGGSTKAMDEIVLKRDGKEYEGLEDLCMRVDSKKVTKKSLELLVKCGAMDKFGKRSALLQVIPFIYDKAESIKKVKSQGQISLFAGFEDEEENNTFKIPLPDIPEAIEILTWEKEILGIYTSSHPILPFTHLWKRKDITKLSELPSLKNKSKIKAIGIISMLKKIVTKKDAKAMAFATFEDMSGKIELVIFPNAYEKAKAKLIPDIPVIIKANVETKKGLDGKEETKLFLEDIAILDEKFKKKNKSGGGKTIILNVKPDVENLKKLKTVISNNPGSYTIKILIDIKGNISELAVKETVAVTDHFLNSIKDLCISYNME